ncbi:MAG: carboxypeptidase regulatory-like domain-containing protein [Sedimentisphaerales bacterium]|nr:carboxypeptidase regulatory-like domain-containing protein [Sedimentisphaerales bacterium]
MNIKKIILVYAIFIASFNNLSIAQHEDKFTFKGKVVDALGKPAAHAQAILYSEKETRTRFPDDLSVIGETKTNEAGEFSFVRKTGDENSSYGYIVVEKEGLALDCSDWYMGSDKEVEFRLNPVKKLSGIVTDEKGQPVSNANVGIIRLKIENTKENIHTLGTYITPNILNTKTDEIGRFSFNNLPANATVEFVVQKTARAMVNTNNINKLELYSDKLQFSPGQENIRLVQPPESVIDGIVVDKSTGKPVSGIKFKIKHGRNQLVFGQDTIISGEDGTFSIRELSAGSYFLALNTSREKLADWVAEPVYVDLKDGQTEKDIKLELQKGGLLEVLVKDSETGEPIEGASVSVLDVQHELWFSGLSDSKGISCIRLMPKGYQNVTVNKDYTSEVRYTFNALFIEDGSTKKIDWLLKKPPKVKGIVYDPDGKPVEGAKLIMLPTAEEEITTDSEGRYEIIQDERLWPGGGADFWLVARHNERNLAVIVDVTEKSQTLDLKLQPGVTITGKVADSEGKGIPHASVSPNLRTSDWSYSVTKYEKEEADENGNFEFGAIPAGHDYTIRARAEGYTVTNKRLDFQDTVNNHLDAGQVTLFSANLTVSGIVVDIDGKPVVNARIVSSGDNQPDFAQVYSDKEGKFELIAAKGKLQLQATKTGQERLYGYVNTEGGAKNVTIVLGGDPIASRTIPKQPSPLVSKSLINKSIPKFENIEIDFSPEQAKGKRIFICFWDMEQKPSRNSVTELAKRTDELNEKNIEVLLIHSSEVTVDELKNWLDEYKIPFISGRITSDFDKVKFNWGVRGLPWLILTDKNGKIQAEGIDLEEGMKVINSSYYDDKTVGQVLQTTSEPSVRIIKGIVKDVNGLPVKDTVISTMPFPGEEFITDNEGKFQFRRVVSSGTRTMTFPIFPENIYIFARQKDRNLAAAVEFDDKTDNYEITLIPGVIISSKVVDINGIGIQNADMTLIFWASESGISKRESTKINSDGSFEIRALPNGFRYSVQAKADGFGDRIIMANTGEAVNDRLDLEPLVLEVANLSVSGIVVDQFDQPISNIRIYAYGSGQPSMLETYTNTKGEFVLGGLSPGWINLQVQVEKEGTEPLVGFSGANAGDKNIKIALSKIISQGRLVPIPPAPLVTKSFPNFENIEIDFSPEQAKGKRILICFWDMEQRPSRNLVTELAKRQKELTEKNVLVLLVQSSDVTDKELNDWIGEYDIPFTSGCITGESQKVLNNWSVRAQPWMILFDSEHIVRAEGFGMGELNEKIENTDKPVTQEEIDKRQQNIAETEIKRLGGEVVVKTSENGQKYTEVTLHGPKYQTEWTGGEEGIKHLKWLPNLKSLRIQEVENFTDESMEQLKDIKSLESLILVRSDVSDEGLVYLKDLTNLEFLGLWINNQFTDKSLDHMKGLTKLKSLRLDDAQITDNGVMKLKQYGILKELEFFVLSGTQITDDGLAHLQGMDKVKRLYLGNTQISDDGLKYLAGLSNMEVLILNKTNITDKSMEYLKGLKKINMLYLSNTQISDKGLEHLKELTNLVQLWIGGTKITDAGLEHIQGLENLESISLESTGITDKGLEYLKPLKNLNEIFLNNSDITLEGYMNLNETFPGCQIIWESENNS